MFSLFPAMECIHKMPKRFIFIKTLSCGIHNFNNIFFSIHRRCHTMLLFIHVLFLFFGRKQKPLQSQQLIYLNIYGSDSKEQQKKRLRLKIINRFIAWCDREKKTKHCGPVVFVAFQPQQKIFIDSKRHLYINQVQCSWYFGFSMQSV